jgi:hypothetical protein
MKRTLIALGLVAAPQAALACPVCFGDANAPMTVAANAGIWFMLAIVGAMLTAFATFFVYLVRRARLAARSSEPAEARFGSHHQGQEGTAQC